MMVLLEIYRSEVFEIAVLILYWGFSFPSPRVFHFKVPCFKFWSKCFLLSNAAAPHLLSNPQLDLLILCNNVQLSDLIEPSIISLTL